MTEAAAIREPSQIADFVLAIEGPRGRSRKLRQFRPAFTPDLVRELCSRANEEIRRDPVEAGRRARLGALVARVIGDHAGRAACQHAHARAALVRGAFPTALAALDRAAYAARDGAEGSTIGLDVLRLQVLTHLERYDEALELGQRTLEAFESDDDVRGAVQVRMALADLAFRRDLPREALRHYTRVERDAPSHVTPRLRGALAANRANALEACNRFRAARRHFDIAREVFAAEGCDHTVAQVDYNAAYAEASRGRYEEALRRYSRSEAEFTRLGDERHLAHIDLDRAEIHLHLNLSDDAELFAAAAEARFARLGLEKESAQAAHLAGRAAELRGDLAAAEACLSRAQGIFARLGLAERRFGCLVELAGLAERSGRLDDAAVLAHEAEEHRCDGMNPLSAASIALLRARLDLAADRPGAALARAEEVLENCRRIHAPWLHLEAERIAGHALEARGALHDAVDAFVRAIDHLESYRGGVPADEFMAAFLAGRSAVYADVVRIAVRHGDTARAFEYAERAKSRALVDLLAGRIEGVADRRLDDAVARRVAYLRQRLNAIYAKSFRSIAECDTERAEQARCEASRLERVIARLLRDGMMRDHESASLAAVDGRALSAVQADLEPGVVLLEYFLDGDELFTFLVTRDDARAMVSKVSTDDLRSRVERFRFHLTKLQRMGPSAEERILPATTANLRELTKILLTPVSEWLVGSRLVIVPHGVLHHVPFHALPWGEGWLADEFEIVYAPSAAVYGLCGKREPTAVGDPCVLGIPDEAAPRIEEETQRVAEVLGTRNVHLGDRVTFDLLREQAACARILHVATHGMFRPAQPMLSSIKLADRWVNLYDLYDLEVAGELVVLSTCESGTADVTGGDEILGLTRGFLYAGAPALLTSQWRVDDAVTTDFMTGFYRHLEELGDAASAHRAAMADIRSRHPHPYYWAPFFLTGRPVVRAAAATSIHTGHARSALSSGNENE